MRKRNIMVLLVLIGYLLPAYSIAGESVRIVSETARSISIAVDVPEPVCESSNEGRGLVCSVPGFEPAAAIGMPAVVQRGITVAIPPGAQVALSVDIHSVQEFSDIDLQTLSGPGRDSFPEDEYCPAQPADIVYTGYLRGVHVARILITPLQYHAARRTLHAVRSMTITLEFDGGDYRSGVLSMLHDGVPASSGSVFESIRSAALINSGSPFARAAQVRTRLQASQQPAGELDISPFAVRMVTAASGIYRIRYEDIAALGVDMSGLTVSNLKVENRGREVALYRSGTGAFSPGDYILFYAEDFQSEYSRTNAYWLYQGTGSGLTMQTQPSAPVSGFDQPSSFTTTERLEQDLIWRRNLPGYQQGEDQWFWQLLNVFDDSEFDIIADLKEVAVNAGDVELELYLRGLTAFNHRTTVSVNGTQVSDFTWQGSTVERRTFTGISAQLLNPGVNTLTIQALTAPGNDPASTPDSYYVNWAALTYARHYMADENRLAFTADEPGGVTFEVSGFTGSDIRVFDVSEPSAPVVLAGASVASSGGSSRVRFERVIEPDSALFALSSAAFLPPDSLTLKEPSHLRASRTAIDYIIITHELFAETVKQLKSIREQAGLNVEIVDVQTIYDEFSYGIKDIHAIRDFLRHAYFNWHAEDHPTYVVLVGDATYDYRDNMGLAAAGKADLIPTYLGYRTNLVGATASDNWFVCVDGDDPLPDMIIGRLCVKNNQDLQNIIDKIIAYESAPEEEWNSRAVFAADRDDRENLFENISERLAEEFPDEYTEQSLYLREYGSNIAAATEDLRAAISSGALITNYVGHGATDTWSKRRWFMTPNQNTGEMHDDVALLTNRDQYTFVVVLNCLSGTFSEVIDDYSMAEEFVRQPERGAIACVAPSAAGFPFEHELLGIKLYEGLFRAGITSVGALLTRAKIAAYDQTGSRDLLETFLLFGDPALDLNIIEIEPQAFRTLKPLYDDRLAFRSLPTFAWTTNAHFWFKVEFSTSQQFEPELRFNAPLVPFRFLTEGQYRPNLLVWSILRQMAGPGGTMYWRVVAYDEDFNVAEYSDFGSFRF